MTARVTRAAFPKGNPYLRLRDELGPVFPDGDFADLYPRRRSKLSCASRAGNTGARTPDVAPRWRSEMIEWIKRHWVVAAAGAGVVATWSACFIITFLRAH